MRSRFALIRVRRATAKGESLLQHGDFDAAEDHFSKAVTRTRGRDGCATSELARAVAAARIGLGRTRLARDDLGGALSEFQAAQLLQPEGWEGFYWEGCAHAHGKNYLAADHSLTTALKYSPPLGRTYLQRAFTRLRRDDLDGALTDLLAADQDEPLGEEARVLLAWLRLRRSEWPQAEELLRSGRSEALAPVVAPMLAYALDQQGRLEEAATWYSQAVGDRRAGDAALFRYGLAAYRLERYESAVDAWSELHRRHPGQARLASAVAQANYAWAYQLNRSDDFDGAVTCLEACDGHFAPGALNAALSELHLHAAADALALPDRAGWTRARLHLEAGLIRDPREVRTRHYLALTYGLDGAFTQALTLLDAALAMRPSAAGARYVLALCAVQAGDARRAVRELKRLAKDGDDRGNRTLAALLLRREQWSEAAVLLNDLPADDPLREVALPECRYRHGPPGKLSEFQPAYPDAACWQAAAYARDGDVDAALSAIAAIPSHAGSDRVRRELVLRLRSAALAEVGTARWTRAASLLTASRRLTGMPAGSPLLDAVVLTIGGQRTAAVAGLLDSSGRDPGNHLLTHGLALMLLHGLVSGAGGQELDGTPLTWPRCIASWAALLHDTPFWEARRREAEARYGVAVPAALMDSLRAETGQMLRDAIAGAEPSAEHREHLLLLLERELEAARALADAGGFPLPGAAGGPPVRLICGPLRIGDLGVESQFGAFAIDTFPDRSGLGELLEMLAEAMGRDLIARDYQEPDRARRDAFFRCFSQLGVAQVHLLAGRPRDALDALSDLRCPHCKLHSPPAPAGQVLSAVCSARCRWFDTYNPAYAALPDKFRRLAHDAVTLSVDACLEAGQAAAIDRQATDAAAAAASWAEAIRRAETIGQEVRVRERVTQTALRCAAALERSGRTDDAIDLLEAVCQVSSAQARDRLAGRLAESLTDRGIATANEDPDQVGDSVADLRRAVELNPHLVRAVANLTTALRMLAAQQANQGQFTQARNLLEEAVQRLKEARLRISGHRDIEGALPEVEGELQMLRILALLNEATGGGWRSAGV